MTPNEAMRLLVPQINAFDGLLRQAAVELGGPPTNLQLALPFSESLILSATPAMALGAIRSDPVGARAFARAIQNLVLQIENGRTQVLSSAAPISGLPFYVVSAFVRDYITYTEHITDMFVVRL